MARAPQVTRFAPSPTGSLHLGHAFSALFARHAAGPDGVFLLRIEDIDQGRARAEFIAGIEEDLHWLGLDWPCPVRRQSEHLDDYNVALTKLTARGLTYPCFCTRAEIRAEIAAAGGAPQGAEGEAYPGTCRRLSQAERDARIADGLAYALRLDLAAAMMEHPALSFTDDAAGPITADPRRFGDIVLARKDTPTSYHLAVTLDDAAQGVTLVTRGVDLLPATHIHRLIQALFDLPVPRYRHHPLIRNEAGVRLAKRDHAEALSTLRARGVTASEIIARFEPLLRPWS